MKKHTVRWLLVPLMLGILIMVYPQAGRAQTDTSFRYISEPFGKQLRSGAISPDGRLLAVVGNKKDVSLYSLPDGQEKQQLMLAASSGERAAFDPTGKFLAVENNDWHIEIFDIASGERKYTVRGTSLIDGTTRTDFREEGILLRYLGQDSLLIVTHHVVSLWTPSGDRRALLNFWPQDNRSIQSADRYFILSASVSGNDEMLAVGFQNGTINLYDIRNLSSIRLLRSFRVPPRDANINEIESVAVSAERNLLFGGAYDGLREWNINSGEQVRHEKYEKAGSMSLSPRGDLIGISYGRTVKIRTLTGSTLNSVLGKRHTHTVILSPDSKYLVGIETIGSSSGVWVRNIEAERLAAPKADAKLKAQQADERVKQQRAAESLQAELAKKERQLQADIARFRSSLKAGSETSCGPVIEIKGALVKVYFPVANYGNEHWIRRNQLYPPGYGCRFVNGRYQPPND